MICAVYTTENNSLVGFVLTDKRSGMWFALTEDMKKHRRMNRFFNQYRPGYFSKTGAVKALAGNNKYQTKPVRKYLAEEQGITSLWGQIEIEASMMMLACSV